jgi:hypothetical protein
VQQIVVSAASAWKICERYPHLNALDIEGLAYDSLFKQVCAAGALKTSEDRQIFAPFSFVSVLAGVYLAVEFLRRATGIDTHNFNYWRVSPWSSPNVRLQQRRPINPRCQFCHDEILRGVAEQLWGHRGAVI